MKKKSLRIYLMILTVFVLSTICISPKIYAKTTSNDKKSPKISISYFVYNQKANVAVKAVDKESGIDSIIYLKGKVTDTTSPKWSKNAKKVINNKFTVSDGGTYSVLATDRAGNKTVKSININVEFRAVWISYLEFQSIAKNEIAFKKAVDEMFDNCQKWNMNAVVVQVRAFSDAMYDSSYFPWSKYASGTLGKNPGYDPLEYMVEAAHERNLEFHAWINPYRITTSGTNVNSLPDNHPAKKWRQKEDKKRNVITYANALYYNPATKDVQNLIVNGVKEIVDHYDVDGIHFDDYFYPNLGSSYASKFDAEEYRDYKEDCKRNGKKASDIVTWRRNNVNSLVKAVYQTVKASDSNCEFGISPQGNISNLLSNQSYYVDIKTWLSSSDYVDYICPQIYWGIHHKTAPFEKKMNEFLDIRTSDTVKVYIGLAVYKCGSKADKNDTDWSTSNQVISDQILLGRKSGQVDGYMFFRYEQLNDSKRAKERANLLKILK
ncbi:glycoside hydrolase family 10 protein [Velocimicrobium porci]|uniref:Family 10 glycosylhydrolase n=1 Tax=Velocimicrobium porci TaxID=2606634 RepID=A0A6L5Y0Z8_9FIRM|nr:family 10 glycosylhydrolase [Velocimicrobium porci]MSS64361.1 family 10 glycosylhydrolase [Velocimicrobium porci]